MAYVKLVFFVAFAALPAFQVLATSTPGLTPLELENQNLPGYDFNDGARNVKAVWKDCKRQCDNIFATTGQCRAWAYVNTSALASTLKQPRGSCWLKSSDGIKPIKQKGWIAGNSHKAGVDIPSDEKLRCSRFIVPGPEQCALICKAWDYKPRCTAWTYEANTQKCHIKNKATKLRATNSNNTIGTRV